MSASPHESKRVTATIGQRLLPEILQRMIGDGDTLDAEIRQRFGVELIALHNPRAAESLHRTVAFSDASGTAGKWSVCLPGCITIVAS